MEVVMNIGIDIDGVLVDVGAFELDYGAAHYIPCGKHIVRPFVDDTDKIFDVPKAIDDEWWDSAFKVYSKMPARPFANKIIDMLKKSGHKIYIISNRVSDLTSKSITKPQMLKMVKKWLKKNKIHYDVFVSSSGHKTKDIKSNKIDIMIEDVPAHIKEQRKVCQVFCYNTIYNTKVEEGNNVTRVFCWYDIYDKIQNLSNNQSHK